jgi:hypothetical protein
MRVFKLMRQLLWKIELNVGRKWVLGDLKEKRYFFRTRKRSSSEDKSKCKRAAGSGYWKPVGKEKQILASESNQALGIRTTLVFCDRKCSNGSKTRWVMHEYRLPYSTLQVYTIYIYTYHID